MSFTSTDWPIAAAAPTSPSPIFNLQRPGELVGIADRIGDRKLLALGIQEVDGEGLKRGQARNELRNLVQQLVDVEDGRDLASKLEERGHDLPDVLGHGRLGRRGRDVGSLMETLEVNRVNGRRCRHSRNVIPGRTTARRSGHRKDRAYTTDSVDCRLVTVGRLSTVEL